MLIFSREISSKYLILIIYGDILGTKIPPNCLIIPLPSVCGKTLIADDLL
jgi:hypothetical protein